MAVIKLKGVIDGEYIYFNTEYIVTFSGQNNDTETRIFTINGNSFLVDIRPEELADMLECSNVSLSSEPALPPPVNWVADSDWIDNEGSIPDNLSDRIPVAVKFRNGKTELTDPYALDWNMTGGNWDIVQYRMVRAE